ncbi:MAG: hypothetical protein HQL44_01980 [Alphaproteobacteria bacterium]|nr:hypothetical protein [Alphaproteobacteria bacterium]
MPEKFLLYIDILGFSDPVVKRGNVDRLYEIIDALNAHRHPDFKVIVFSDTILVYNMPEPTSLFDVQYGVMYLCEFAQDLFYRCISMDIHFRGYITYGDFNHQPMKNIEAYYGEGLIRAHEAEKEIQCTGLFMDNIVCPYSNIFQLTPFNKQYQFVHIMQNLKDISLMRREYPIPPEWIIETDLLYLIAYDIHYLESIHHHMNDMLLATKVRRKYLNTWKMLKRHHQGLLAVLVDNSFNPRAVSDFDWSEAMGRIGTDQGFFR